MKPKYNHAGIVGIRAQFQDAKNQLEDSTGISDPEPNISRDGIQAGKWDGAPHDNMPPACPVKVLGHNGNVTYCVSATGQMHEIEKWDHATIVRLFAPQVNFAYWAWPGFSAGGKDSDGQPLPPVVKRLERDKVSTCLIQEGARRGLFDPKNRVRGRGGWKAANDEFIWNSGEWLWSVDKQGQLQRARPGVMDGDLYTRLPDVTQPWAEPVKVEDTPATRILEDLKSWNWERPFLDPILFLGWIACSLMGGALEWRPIVFTTGGAGVGKSTLHRIVQAILEDTLHALVDTTSAGIYQHVKADSLPVTVDELEAKKGSSKATSIIELARLASSGGKMARGGASHEGTVFQARSCFMFSAILPPPMGVQDKTRMAILNLKRLDKTLGREPVIHDVDGRMLLRQIMDNWSEFLSRILPDWKQTLHVAGFDSRAMDTYGTLLAAAEMLVGADVLEENGLEVSDQKRLAEVIRHATSLERSEQVEKWQECVEHLLNSPIDFHRGGEKATVGSTIDQYEKKDLDLKFAQQRLGLAGLGLRKEGNPGQGACLAIPSQHPALNKIFQETDFFEGGWSLILKQAPTDVVLRGLETKFHNVKIQRTTKRCLLLDLKAYDDLTQGETE
ncbi:hypothetical protein [Pseudovibrio sp. POLY-S9]|uniref:hypothetical protein n=1 Tax=Pseudovibrio sp. POLY-S9 TaxID=1576596 RepID=UPI000A4628CF|nr:hypothetical protein [Pseudovibrio sp. POLY-S9]